MSYLPSTSTGRQLVNAASASAGRNTLGLGTIATQDSNNVSITGGTISGITLIGLEDVRTITTTPVTLDANDKVVVVDTDTIGGIGTVVLPAATGSGRCYIIKSKASNDLANNVVVDGNGSETIDGATTYTISVPGESITIVDTATGEWTIV